MKKLTSPMNTMLIMLSPAPPGRPPYLPARAGAASSPVAYGLQPVPELGVGIIPCRVEPVRPEVGGVLLVELDQGRAQGLRARRLRGVLVRLVFVPAREGG